MEEITMVYLELLIFFKWLANHLKDHQNNAIALLLLMVNKYLAETLQMDYGKQYC